MWTFGIFAGSNLVHFIFDDFELTQNEKSTLGQNYRASIETIYIDNSQSIVEINYMEEIMLQIFEI